MKTITRNHTGHRVGECHQKAKLTDEQVRAMRKDREELGLTYLQLSIKYECGFSTAANICTYRTRASA